MKIIKNIFLFFISFALVLLLSDVFIRFSHLTNVSSTEFYKDTGRGKRENFEYVYFNEGFGVGSFNEHRFLGASVPLKKEESTIRIALLGDSYVEAFHVFERDYFGQIAQRELAKKYPDRKIEILNFGRSGFDVADVYAFHQKMVKKFNPDYVLYFISNDDLEPKYSDPLRPRTILENDSLKIAMHFSELDINTYQKTKFLTQNSTILNMLNDGRKKAKEVSILSILLDKVYLWFTPSSTGVQISKPNEEYALDPVIKKIIQTVDSKKVIVINRDRKELPLKFKQLVIDNRIPYYDLSKPLDSLEKSGTDPNFWKVTKQKGHWNKTSHRVVGNELVKLIDQQIK